MISSHENRNLNQTHTYSWILLHKHGGSAPSENWFIHRCAHLFRQYLPCWDDFNCVSLLDLLFFNCAPFEDDAEGSSTPSSMAANTWRRSSAYTNMWWRREWGERYDDEMKQQKDCELQLENLPKKALKLAAWHVCSCIKKTRCMAHDDLLLVWWVHLFVQV